MSKHDHNRSTRHHRHKVVATLCLLAFFMLMLPVAVAQNPQQPRAAKPGSKPERVSRITPQIPKANRYQKNKVFLENADRLSANEAISVDYQVLKGNVRFRRGDMYMFCDSAYFYDATSSLDAFGHVRMSLSMPTCCTTTATTSWRNCATTCA